MARHTADVQLLICVIYFEVLLIAPLLTESGASDETSRPNPGSPQQQSNFSFHDDTTYPTQPSSWRSKTPISGLAKGFAISHPIENNGKRNQPPQATGQPRDVSRDVPRDALTPWDVLKKNSSAEQPDIALSQGNSSTPKGSNILFNLTDSSRVTGVESVAVPKTDVTPPHSARNYTSLNDTNYLNQQNMTGDQQQQHWRRQQQQQQQEQQQSLTNQTNYISSGNQTQLNYTSVNQTSDNHTSDNPTSDKQISNKQTSHKQTSHKQTSQNATAIESDYSGRQGQEHADGHPRVNGSRFLNESYNGTDDYYRDYDSTSSEQDSEYYTDEDQQYYYYDDDDYQDGDDDWYYGEDDDDSDDDTLEEQTGYDKNYAYSDDYDYNYSYEGPAESEDTYKTHRDNIPEPVYQSGRGSAPDLPMAHFPGQVRRQPLGDDDQSGTSMGVIVFSTWLAAVTVVLVIALLVAKHRQRLTALFYESKLSYKRDRRSKAVEEGHTLLSHQHV